MNYIQEYICEAVDIIVDKRLSSANFNKAIEGIVLSCEDTVLGKYKVKYQDSIFYAYAANPSIVYSVDSLVNILVLGNDMSRDKIIISSIDKKVTNYSPTLNEEDKYETIGSNVITSQTGNIELCSYDTAVVNAMNLFTIDENSLKASLGAGGYLKIKLKVRTALTLNQQAQGDYGVIFKLVFLDSKGKEQTPKEYKFSTRNINGNPYSLETAQEQVVYYKIENASRFKRIDNIQAYVENFPDQREDFPDATDEDFPKDIFISDIELYGAKPLTEEELTGTYVSLLTPQGYIFSDVSTEDKTIVADVKINGSATTRKINYYWFKENINVMSNADEGYNILAGSGWECLNSKAESEWVPGDNYITVTMLDVAAKKIQYKCIVQFVDENNTTYEQTITMENVASKYQIEIISEEGYKFWYGNGTTVLTCKAYENNTKINFTGDYRFIWKRVETDGGTYYYDSNKDVIFDNNVKGWYENVKYRISINPAAIVNRNDYYCYVYNGDTFLGYGKTSLSNSTEQTSSDFHIVLQNGQQTFLYDKNGLSPNHSTKNHKITLPTLSFTLYDNEHQVISANKIKSEDGKIQWKIPYENTMLKANVDVEPSESDVINKYDVYELDTFDYSIVDSYDYNNINNNIILEVTYQDLIIRATTDFSFVKDNVFETGGSDIFLSALPNYGGNTFVSYYPAGESVNRVYHKRSVDDIFCNTYSALYNNQLELFTPTFWKGATPIEIDKTAVVWSVLNTKGKTSFSLGGNTDNLIAFNLRAKDDAFNLYNNILRATFNYNNKKYFTEIPVITVNMYNTNYQIMLKQNTGYQFVQYDKNGYNPSYDAVHPFEIIVGEGSLGRYSLVTDLTDYTFDWNYTSNFIEISDENLSDNKKIIAPNDIYEGNTYNEAIFIQVYHNGSLIGNIHIPVYMYLDRVNAEDIDGWDGNFIVNSNEEILSPKGYGSFDSDTFSGVFFGKVNTEDLVKRGLFLYQNGKCTLETTPSSFIIGAIDKDNGYININSETGIQLYSGNYKSNNSGLLIDLAAAKIKYENGSFELDENGVIKALTLDPSVQISGNNIDEDFEDSKGLGKILSKYTLLTVYNEKMSAIDKNFQDVNLTITNLVSNIENTYATKKELNELKLVVESHTNSLESINLTINNYNERLNTIEKNYITSNSLNNILTNYSTEDWVTKQLANYVTTKGLNQTLTSYVTTEALENKNFITSKSLKDYVLNKDFSELDSSIAALLGLSGETCINTEDISIAPIINGGSIIIGDDFTVSEEGILNATKADLKVKSLVYENPMDTTDTIDLIEEIKALKAEIEILKEQLEGGSDTPAT